MHSCTELLNQPCATFLLEINPANLTQVILTLWWYLQEDGFYQYQLSSKVIINRTQGYGSVTVYAQVQKAGPLQDQKIQCLNRLYNRMPDKSKELQPIIVQVLFLDSNFNTFFLVQHRQVIQILVIYEHLPTDPQWLQALLFLEQLFLDKTNFTDSVITEYKADSGAENILNQCLTTIGQPKSIIGSIKKI